METRTERAERYRKQALKLRALATGSLNSSPPSAPRNAEVTSNMPACSCRNPAILVMEPAQDRKADNGAGRLDGTDKSEGDSQRTVATELGLLEKWATSQLLRFCEPLLNRCAVDCLRCGAVFPGGLPERAIRGTHAASRNPHHIKCNKLLLNHIVAPGI